MYDRVMIIDDNSIDRYVGEISLVRYGFTREVVSKESAASALEYLSSCTDLPQNLPQLIFLDINMPEINGFEFLEAFSKLPAHLQNLCEIIMLSSSIDPLDRKKINGNKQVSRFMSKPLKKENLYEILDSKQRVLKSA